MTDGSVFIEFSIFFFNQILENFSLDRISNKKKNPFSFAGIWEKKVTPLLATSDCLPVIFFFFLLLPPPSWSLCCYCCSEREILKNIYECLQCPPHWNSWGKVSRHFIGSRFHSLSHCIWRIGYSFFPPPTESLGRIRTTLHWFFWCLNIYDRIRFWISHGVVCCHCFKLSKFLWLRRLLRGRGSNGILGGTVDGFFYVA